MEECSRLRVVISTLEELLTVQEQVAARQSANLQASADFLREIYKAMPGVLIVVDPAGTISATNEAMLSLLGYTEEELIGQPAGLIFRPTDAPSFSEIEACSDRNAVLRTEKTCISKVGVEIPVLFSARMLRPAGSHQGSQGAICIALDIRERKKLEIELRHAQKLESVGQLAAGIAHEINTPTQYIGDNVRFLRDAFTDLRGLLAHYERLLAAAKNNALSPETWAEISAAVERCDSGYLLEEIPKAIQHTLEGVGRVSTLVGAMREFSHPGTKEKVALDLHKTIEASINLSRNEWKDVADLETDFDSSLPKVPCLSGELSQVVLNLILNAGHAIADALGQENQGKGKIIVRTRKCQDWAEIRIEDTGTGIPECVRGRIFDPFFTTKEVGKGTGQGLAIACSVVVDKLGGSIRFETEVGKGTTFIIRLPCNSTEKT
jgi:PAS domain S-box-containing protein